MNLQRIDQSTHKIAVYCVGCKRMRGTGYSADPRLWADLDGPAFKAYYCHDCVSDSTKLAVGMASYASA